MREVITYISFDNKVFYTKEKCLEHEKYQQDLMERMRNFSVMDGAKLEKLISDLKEALAAAYWPGIVDTMGSPQARAICYMRNVCQKFVEENKEYKMI